MRTMPAPRLPILLSAMLTASLAGAAELAPGPTPEPDPDGETAWYDGAALAPEGKAWGDTESPYDRLPARARETVPPAVWNLSRNSAGLRIRFRTTSPSVRVRWVLRSESLAMPHMPATGVSGVDLYGLDENGTWHFIANGRPAAKANEAAFSPGGYRELALYLPLYNGVESLKLGIPRTETLSPAEPSNAGSVLFYGTSITQGGCVSRPGLATPAIVSRRLGVPTVNLGFSGNGRMEEALADLLAASDPAVYVLDCLWNMSAEQVAERVPPFVRRLRAAHPDTPIVLAEDSNVRNRVPTAKGRILRDAVASLRAEGVRGLHVLSAEGMLGTDGEGTVDGCHPNDLGMMRQAGVFTEALRPILENLRHGG